MSSLYAPIRTRIFRNKAASAVFIVIYALGIINAPLDLFASPITDPNTGTVIDLCSNIPGNQLSVPSGYTMQPAPGYTGGGTPDLICAPFVLNQPVDPSCPAGKECKWVDASDPYKFGVTDAVKKGSGGWGFYNYAETKNQICQASGYSYNPGDEWATQQVKWDKCNNETYVYWENGQWKGRSCDAVSHLSMIYCARDSQTPVVPPLVYFSSNLSTVNQGGFVTLTWNSSGAGTCTASGDWSGQKLSSGSEVVSNLQSNKTFTLSCTGATGTTDSSVSVTVTPMVPPDAKPDGVLDSASCTNINGWSYDPDFSSKSIAVKLYADGPAGSGTFLADTTANQSRPDVNTAKGITGNHGFSIAFPKSLKDGHSHSIYAYGINYGNPNDGGTNNKLLGGSPKTVTSCTLPPAENLAPSIPTVTGTTTGFTNVSYVFSARSTDPEGDTVNYGFDWKNDGVTIDYTGLVASGVSASLAHTWTTPGTYTFKVTPRDAFDHYGPAKTYTIVISDVVTPPVHVNVPPNVPTVTGPGTAYVNDSASFTVAATDPERDNVKYGMDWDNNGSIDEYTNVVSSGTPVALSHSWAAVGTYSFSAYAIDASGAKSSAYQSSIIISSQGGGGGTNLAPSIPTVTGTTTGFTNVSYVFSARSTDPEGDTVNYGFDWKNDGVTIDYTGLVASGVSASLAHTWTTPGTYTFKVTPRDAFDHYGAPAMHTIIISDEIVVPSNNTPALSPVSGPVTGSVNTSYSFKATATDADGDDVSYAFDWNNDGVVGTGAGEEWSAPVSSGTGVTRSNSWTTSGAKSFKVFVRDSHGAITSVSASIDIAGNQATGSFTVSMGTGLSTSENGSTAVFTVVLDNVPFTDVFLPITSSDWSEATTSDTVLVFTPSNWNVYQTITVKGMDDAMTDGDISYTVSIGPSTSNDVNFNAMSSQTVSLINYDNDSSNGGGNGNASTTISAFSIQPQSITSGETATVLWASSNAVSCVASGDWNGSKGVSGTEVVGPFTATAAVTKTFVLDCGNANGTTTQSITLTVNPASDETPIAPRSRGGSSSGGPCYGYACTASNTPVAKEIMILIDSVQRNGGVPSPIKVCKADNFIASYLRKGVDNDVNDVKKLQYFLNTYEQSGLVVDGFFGTSTENAVEAFQLKYSEQILAPWGVTEPTGIVYITTTAEINAIYCGDHPEYINNESIKDILGNSVLDNQKTNNAQFEGTVGFSTSTPVALHNTASAAGALTDRVVDLLKDIPWYPLLVLILILAGSYILGEGIIAAIKRDNGPYDDLYRTIIRGCIILGIGTMLSVLNTLSFMLGLTAYLEKIGVSLSWVLTLNTVNVVSVSCMLLGALFVIYRKIGVKVQK